MKAGINNWSLCLMLCGFVLNCRAEPWLFPVEVDDQFGYIDEKGKVIIKPQYFRAYEFQTNGLACVMDIDFHGYCFIRFDGSVAFTFNKVADVDIKYGFCEGLIRVNTDRDATFMTMSGSLAFDRTFSDAYKFSCGLAGVKINKKWGYINREGGLWITNKFDWVSYFYDNFAEVMVGGKYGFIDTNGNYLVEPKYLKILLERQEGGLVSVRDEDGWKFVDKQGLQKVQGVYDGVRIFVEGLAPVKIHKKWGYIDRNGGFVIEPKFDDADCFSEGLAIVEIDGKCGFIDKNGSFVIEPKFAEVQYFSEGLAAAKLDGKWGFINRQGDVVIKPQFCETPRGFDHGLSKVEYNTRIGYIDKKGVYVWPPGGEAVLMNCSE